jgi:hypothetical protein
MAYRLAQSIRSSAGYFLILAAISTPVFGGISRVPEIDGGMIGSAVALLVGGYLVVVSRTRK